MKCKIVVNRIKWADTNDEGTFIEFSVYKKGLFGGLKEVRDFEGSCLYISHGKDGEIDLDLMFIQDGNFNTCPFDPLLAVHIFRAAIDTISESGGGEKSQLLLNAIRRLSAKK